MPDPDIMSLFHQYIWLLLRSVRGQEYFLVGRKNIFWPGAKANKLTKDRHNLTLLLCSRNIFWPWAK
jgi:hypothetical protein